MTNETARGTRGHLCSARSPKLCVTNYGKAFFWKLRHATVLSRFSSFRMCDAQSLIRLIHPSLSLQPCYRWTQPWTGDFLLIPRTSLIRASPNLQKKADQLHRIFGWKQVYSILQIQWYCLKKADETGLTGWSECSFCSFTIKCFRLLSFTFFLLLK